MCNPEHMQGRLFRIRWQRWQAQGEFAHALSAVRKANIRHQSAPQPILPAGVQRTFASLPGQQPIKSIDQILPVQTRQAIRQLEASARRLVAFQVATDLRVRKRRQQIEYPPAQSGAPVRRDRNRLGAQHLLSQALQPLARQHHVEVRRHPRQSSQWLLRQMLSQPALHAEVANDQLLRRQY